MKVNNGEFFCTFNGKLSSFALFNGEAVMDLSPYQRSINYQAADNDRKFLMQLRTTSENLQPEQGEFLVQRCHVISSKIVKYLFSMI